MAAADALLAVSVELEGGRIVHHSFISTDAAKACGNVGHLWEKVASSLEPEALAKCGSMRKVPVLAAPAATHPAGFCMQAESSVASILDMGVTAVKFQAATPMLPAPPPLSLALALRREPAAPSELGSGRPAHGGLFVKLRAQLVDAGVKGHRGFMMTKHMGADLFLPKSRSVGEPDRPCHFGWPKGRSGPPLRILFAFFLV